MRLFIYEKPGDAENSGAIPHEDITVSWPLKDGVPDTEFDQIITLGANAEGIARELVASGIDPIRLAWSPDKGKTLRRLMVLTTHRLDQLPNEAPIRHYPSGINGLEPSLRWRSNELVLVAGPYSSGKSLFAQLLVQDWVLNVAPHLDEEKRPPASALIYAFEDDMRDVRAGFQAHQRTALRDDPKGASMLMSRTFMVECDPNADRKISDFLELVRQHRAIHNTRFFVLDPWNEADHEKHSKQTEGEYVREVLKEMRRLKLREDVVIVVVTHVSAEFIGSDGSLKPFKASNAFGTSQFSAKADRAFCVMRTKRFSEEEKYHMVIRADKIKKEDKQSVTDRGIPIVETHMGSRRTMLFQYSSSTNSIYYDKQASEKAKDVWKD